VAKRSRGTAHGIPGRLKTFKSIGWFSTRDPNDYLSHILMEMGRLGLEIHEVERYDRPPNTRCVLSDLLAWQADQPGAAYANLVDWRWLDFQTMLERFEADPDAKPRIEIAAEVSSKRNFSVRWYPAGWKAAPRAFPRSGGSNMIGHRLWKSPPDFRWFVGDEKQTFSDRATNELMYIRGVGGLDPLRESGPYAKCDMGSLDELLICALRAAYENLIESLEQSFEVTVLHAFDFEIREESDPDDPYSLALPTRRVSSWTLGEARTIMAKQKEASDRAALDRLTKDLGISVEEFVQELSTAAGKARSDEEARRMAAKSLRELGHKADAGTVRETWRLLAIYMPEALPEELRPRRTARPTAKVLPFAQRPE